MNQQVILIFSRLKKRLNVNQFYAARCAGFDSLLSWALEV